MLCWFLPYINMNQPKIYTCPLPLEPPSHLPFHPTQVVTEHQTEIPALYSKFPLAISLTHGNVYTSMAPSQFVPPFPFPLCVHKSVLYPCPENRFINTLFLDSIYMHQYIQYFFFLFLIYFTLYIRVQVHPPHYK